ncbi:MAG: hypothetical protein ACI9NT_001696 [Bacteroidia bacterium]|jgi:hypothetical protein
MRYFLVTLFLFAFSQHAAAYLDPGTGSMILQGLIAGFAVAAFTIKSYWYRIRGYFGTAAPKGLLDEDEEPKHVNE